MTGERADAALASLGLTSRQTEVLGLLLRGQSNKLIARALNLSVETTKDHVAADPRSVNVSSRIQAVLAVSRIANSGLMSSWREAPEAPFGRQTSDVVMCDAEDTAPPARIRLQLASGNP